MPDSTKNFMPDGSGAANWHYLDADSRGYDPLPYHGKYYGELPWAMKSIFDVLVQYLNDGNWNMAAEMMGAICHFAADASCPLHATYDYDNPEDYAHSAYEGAVNSHISEISIPDNYVPQYLDDITTAALVTLAGSFDFTDEDPNGGINISDYLENYISWNPEIKSMTENRVRAGVQFTANVWFTAMVQAGLATALISSVDTITPYWKNSIPFEITATASEGLSVSLYYRYSTDGSSWGENKSFENAKQSPYLWSFTAPQGDGYYAFYSRASDGDNEESPPAVADATCGVDRVAPTSSVNTISPYWRTSVPFDITATASDATRGVKNVSLFYRRSGDNTNWGNWENYGTDTASPWKWSFTAPSGNGYYEFYSIAVDKLNNAEQAPTEADARCRVDTTAPSAPVKSSPADGTITNDNRPTFTWAAATGGIGGIARYELWVDDDSDFSSPEILENTTDNAATSYTPTTGLAYSNYSWRVRAWDQAGNPGPFESTWMFSINATLPPASRGVEVSISPSSQSGTPGTTLTYTVTVTNTGNVTDTYALEKGDNASWITSLSNSSVGPLSPDASESVTLSVTVPGNAVTNARDNIWVKATSTENTAVSDTASCIAQAISEVIRGVKVSISPSPQENIRGGTLRYTVTVTNTGNVTERYNLSKTDTRTWTLTLVSSVADVVPGENRQVTLTVGIPAAAENNTYDNITVTATSSENTAIENSASCTARCVTSEVGVTSLTIFPSRFALYPGYTGHVQDLMATLRDSNHNPLANKVITWSATTGSVSSSSGTTDAVGQISVTYTAPTVTAQTSVTITATFAGDDLYGASSGTSSGIPAIPVSENIPASTGGTIVINFIQTNVTVNILVVPPNALSENTAITVVEKPIEAPLGYASVSPVFDIGPSGTTFTTPSTLTLPYDENELPAGVSEDDLAIYCRIGNNWERLGGTVDKTANTISIQIDHLSEYTVMTSVGEVVQGGLPLLTIGIVIAVVSIIAVIALLIRRDRAKEYQGDNPPPIPSLTIHSLAFACQQSQ